MQTHEHMQDDGSVGASLSQVGAVVASSPAPPAPAAVAGAIGKFFSKASSSGAGSKMPASHTPSPDSNKISVKRHATVAAMLEEQKKSAGANCILITVRMAAL